MSQLLDSPEIKSYVDRGELVPDAMVLDTTDLSIEQAIDAACAVVAQRLGQ
jgi:adenylate kinase family enzyme